MKLQNENQFTARLIAILMVVMLMMAALPVAPVKAVAPLAPTTGAVTSIGTTTATGNGTINDLGTPAATQYGVVWGTAPGPTIALPTRTEEGAPLVTGAFTSSITGLSPSTLYYVRAYETNIDGTSYGVDQSFTTLGFAPTVDTQNVTNIGTTTATGNGFVTYLGVPNPTQHGVVWNTTGTPTTTDSKTTDGPVSATGPFTSAMTLLAPGTTYYVRAYATNPVGTSYGLQKTFSTLPLAPTVTTQAVTNPAAYTATGNGTITALGGPPPTQYGVVWDINPNPDADLLTSKTKQGAYSGAVPFAFQSSIINLTPNVLYHVRAYATNTAGTSYGVELTFTTPGLTPIVVTGDVSAIGTTTANVNCFLTNLGVPNAVEFGVVWGTSVNPTILGNKIIHDPPVVIEPYTINLTGLTPGTLYHVRAYATNDAGTSYGADLTFTSHIVPTVTTQPVTGILATIATGNGNITNLGVPNVTQFGVIWSMAPNPTVALGTKTKQGVPAGTGAFTSSIILLNPSTLYHVRAYATNDAGTSYGDDVAFTTTPPTFADVPANYWVTLGGVNYHLYDYIEALSNAQLTAGCNTSPLRYCPTLTMTRAESAVFMLRGLKGTTYLPPVAPWDTFADNWTLGPWAEKWAEGMWTEKLTAGCLTNPLRFCPWDTTPREQAAVFGLIILHGAGYTPPPATGVFADMNISYWSTKWAEQAYIDKLIPACGTQAGSGKPLFCPNTQFSRDWAAYMIVIAKALLPAP